MAIDWFDFSKRLRRFLYNAASLSSGSSVMGWVIIEECNHWKVVLVRKPFGRPSF